MSDDPADTTASAWAEGFGIPAGPGPAPAADPAAGGAATPEELETLADLAARPGTSELAEFLDTWTHGREELGQTCIRMGLARLHVKHVMAVWDAGPGGLEALTAGAASVRDRIRAAWMTDDDMLSMTVPPYLLKGYLYRSTVARLVGASGTGKSFLALSIAVAVRGGREWFGHRTREANVVYVVAEGAAGMGLRLRALRQAWGLKDTGVAFLTMPVQMCDGEEWDAFLAECVEREPGLVILDTQARMTLGVDENSNTDMGIVVEAADRLKRATGACVLLVHHTGHERDDRARGASSMKGAMDTELILKPVKVDGSGLDWTQDPGEADGMELRVDKQKDGKPAAPVRFRLRSVVLEGICDEDGDPVSSAVVEVALKPEEGPVRAGSEARLDDIVKELEEYGVPAGLAQRPTLKLFREAREERKLEGLGYRKADVEDAITLRNKRERDRIALEREMGIPVG